MPILKKASRRRRARRGGDVFAVLLLLAILAGVGWLWWHQKKSAERPAHQPVAAAKPAPAPARPPVPSVPSAPARPPVQIVPPAAVANTSPETFPRPVRDGLEAQVALARRAISPGSIDGTVGSQTRAAIGVFQRLAGLPETDALDADTRARLTLAAPVLTDYVVTTNDLARLQPLGATWLAKSQQTALDYETILELVGEKAHSNPLLIRKLNPAVDWADVKAGTILQIPDANYPDPASEAAFVVIHLSERFLEAFDTQTNLLLHCPCSIAAKVEKRPVGELHVVVVVPNPNYTVNPELFPESAELQALGHKLILPPGPNNPVGVAWIGLDRPGYGMHGTPAPEHVGRTESHGCFRLANWDAAYLLKLVWVGMPVEVVP